MRFDVLIRLGVVCVVYKCDRQTDVQTEPRSWRSNDAR